MATRNPAWARDELILALDLYLRRKPTGYGQTDADVVDLSHILNKLPIHFERPDRTRFRNPNGVYMKLCNFLALDPGYKGKGLERGGRLEQEIWREFHDRPPELQKLAEAIKRGYASTAANPESAEEQDEDDFPEGRVLYRMHRARERNSNLIRQAKRKALKRDGRLECGACGFDFARKYGSLGRGFIECHHTMPLSALTEKRRTRLTEVVLLCSNCHRMVHRRRPWLNVGDLKGLVAI